MRSNCERLKGDDKHLGPLLNANAFPYFLCFFRYSDGDRPISLLNKREK